MGFGVVQRVHVPDRRGRWELESDDDTDADDDEWPWLERAANGCIRAHLARDNMSLVRACLKRGFGKGAGKDSG